MDRGLIAFNAIFLRNGGGYLGFIEELPGVNAHGRTLEEARTNLQRLAEVVFDEERQQAEALIEGKDVVRESFMVPFPHA
ncbi:MAG TPA: type II toxin-antitoxin system HicB family antitoxin [Burkholderiales bacterium]|nr:type II toxin-antitoxin system HicB family antitoxin [Burkholderiales bacterium]HVC12402.1 type II toxin-antitoxin system HicB family antitoxin [Burkholderiales bacterium]